ncbi:hypothetical protein OPQ81_011498 [Rhizoctonia solani]|nr:hypothetical protein OPQ81_011498 [Rhizoctonia solani]
MTSSEDAVAQPRIFVRTVPATGKAKVFGVPPGIVLVYTDELGFVVLRRVASNCRFTDEIYVGYFYVGVDMLKRSVIWILCAMDTLQTLWERLLDKKRRFVA